MQRLLIAVFLALAGIGGVAFYYWQQATKLPDWYAANQSMSANQTDQTNVPNSLASQSITEPNQGKSGDRAQTKTPQSTQPSALAKPSESRASLATAEKQPSKTTSRQNELAQRFTTEVTRKIESRKLGSALKGANTTMQNGKVESGAVVNFGDISPNQLPPDERAFFSKLIAAFPELSRQNFYIGVEGKPVVKGGQVQLDDNIRIKLGNLSFTPAQLSERLGIPEDQIRQQLKLQVQMGNLKVEELRVADDRALSFRTSN